MISPEILTNLGVIIAAGLAVLAGHYSRKIFGDPPVPPSATAPQPNALLAGIGIELSAHDHHKQLIILYTRIAVALEILADRKIEDMADMHKEIRDRMDTAERRQKEQEEQKPRRTPRRKPP